MKLVVCVLVFVFVPIVQAYLEKFIGVDYAPGTDRVQRVLHKSIVGTGGAITLGVIAWGLGFISFHISFGS